LGDISNIVAENVVVSTVSNISVSPSGALVVTKQNGGIRDQSCVLKTDGNQVASINYDVTCTILTSDAATFELNGIIETIATP